MKHQDTPSPRGRSKRARGGRGAVAVEFGLIAPLFLLLVFGIVDFGYMINRDTMINNLTRDAARSASIGMGYSSVQQQVFRDLAEDGFCKEQGGTITCPTGTKVTISCVNDVTAMQALEQYDPSNPSADTVPANCGTASVTSPSGGSDNSFDTQAVRGSMVTVKVEYPHDWITPIGYVCALFDRDGSKCTGNTITLSKTAKMTRE